LHQSYIPFRKWSTSQRLVRPTVTSATSTPHTRSPNTRLASQVSSLKERDVTTGSREVSEVRPSQSSTRRPRPPRRSSSEWNARVVTRSSKSSSVASVSSSEERRRRRTRL
ncbi:hypothetical protein SAMD00019534_079540, partial [Acytostelium subglobosum LB1]|uniref:hypothetical protein n=1 Tax=Acytostelium subglobosum LB1 TaxID=1410327 RepID=UPI000644ACC0